MKITARVFIAVVALALLTCCYSAGADDLSEIDKEARELHRKYKYEYPYYCSSSDDPERYYDAGWKPDEKRKGTDEYARAAKEYQDWINSLHSWIAGKREKYDKRIFGKDYEKENVLHIETRNWNFATTMTGRRMQMICLPYPLPKWLEDMLNAKRLSERRVRRLKIRAGSDLSARIYAERLEYLHSVFMEKFEGDMAFGDGEEGAEDPWDVGPDDEEEEEEENEKDDGKRDGDDYNYEIEKAPVGGNKLGYYIWSQVDQQKRASFALGNRTSATGLTVHAPKSFHTCFHTCFDKDRGNDDALLHNVVHTGTSVILSSYVKFERDAVPHWFDEALGHWMEYELLGTARVCTTHELTHEPVIPQKGLRGRIYKMVRRRAHEPLAGYSEANYDILTTDQRVQSFGIVDYMLQEPEKVREWIIHVKNHKNQGRAFRDVYEVSMAEFMDNWAEWVQENYTPTMH